MDEDVSEGQPWRIWKAAWRWSGVGSEIQGRVGFAVTAAGALTVGFTWIRTGLGWMTAILAALTVVLLVIGNVLMIRAVHLNFERKIAKVGADMANEARVVPSAWAAIIEGQPDPHASPIEVVPPGCRVVAAGPGTVNDNEGNSAIGAGSRVYNSGGGSSAMAGGAVGTRPYSLYDPRQ